MSSQEQSTAPATALSNGAWHAEAVDLYYAGVSQKVIAAQFGVSRERIRQVVHKAGLPNPRELLCAAENCPTTARWPDTFCARHLRAWALYGDPFAKDPPRMLLSGTHGTLASYQHSKCRCPECRQANRIRHRNLHNEMRRRGRADPSLIPHGTKSGYSNWGCHCDACFERMFGHERLQEFRPSVRKGKPWKRFASEA